MSITSNKKRQRPATPAPAPETSRAETSAPRLPRRKSGLLTVLSIVGLALALLIGLLPTIIAHTPLMGYLVRRAARLDGTVAFHSASIGWFSSATVSGIEIRDAQGETVLEADSLTCDRSLLKLIFNSSNVGTLRIEKPRLYVILTRDGSNIESTIAPWLTAPSSSSPNTSSDHGVDLSLQVVDGEATIVDQQTQQSWHVTNLQYALDLSRQLALPPQMEARPRSTTADIRAAWPSNGTLSPATRLRPTLLPARHLPKATSACKPPRSRWPCSSVWQPAACQD